eukprot:5911427-Amphidinium_carterae.1
MSDRCSRIYTAAKSRHHVPNWPHRVQETLRIPSCQTWNAGTPEVGLFEFGFVYARAVGGSQVVLYARAVGSSCVATDNKWDSIGITCFRKCWWKLLIVLDRQMTRRKRIEPKEMELVKCQQKENNFE